MNSNTAEPTPLPAPAREPVTMPHTWQGGHLAAWREFTAGMEFLQRYSHHNTANAEVIGRDNLRLLHRSLQQDDGYRELLKALRRKIGQQAFPLRLDLVSSTQLRAHLISMPAESRIHLTSHPGQLSMFMVLHGAAHTMQRGTGSRMRGWWPRSWPRSNADRHGERHHLHVDGIISLAHGNTDTLFTGRRPCLLLAISTPLQAPRHQAENDAYHPSHTQLPLRGAV